MNSIALINPSVGGMINFSSAPTHLYATRAVAQAAQHYVPAPRKEYDNWMEGLDNLQPGKAHRRLLRLADGTVLNRYWNDDTRPPTDSEDYSPASAFFKLTMMKRLREVRN
ncbi:hypothetical protein [Thiomonas sp.]